MKRWGEFFYTFYRGDIMILVLSVVFVGLMVLCRVVIKDEEIYGWAAAFFIVCAGLCIIAAFVLLIMIGGKGKVIDEQISMYEEENIKIEATIDSVVKDYLGYEKDTYKTIRDDENTIASVIAYPELASSELVVKQLEVYVANNEKIKELKKDKIELSREKWWLYFGK